MSYTQRLYGLVAQGAKRAKEFIAPSEQIEEGDLIEAAQHASLVAEMARSPGFKIVQGFQELRKDEIIQRLKYDANITDKDRFLLQGELKGIEGFQKTFETTQTAGERALRMLEERRKEQS